MDFTAGFSFFFGQIGRLLFSLGSHFSLTSLGAALVFSTLFFAWQRLKRGRKIHLRTLWRALFPRHIVTSKSNQADIGYLFFNVFVFGVVFGWAVLSYQSITNGTLYVPQKAREPLKGELIDPLINAAKHLLPKRPAEIADIPVAERSEA